MGPGSGGADDRIGGALAEAFRRGLLPATGGVVVAVSGGQDSLALLHALLTAAPVGLDVYAVHVDHGLRPTSRQDAQHVARVARSLGAKASTRRYDVSRWARSSGLNVEAAARSVRYRILIEVAQTSGNYPIVTGHTGDDQVETVLLHILRGTGLDGLAALRPGESLDAAAFGPAPPRLDHIEGNVTIVRPLLNVERWETAAYCDRRGLRWIGDETNADVSLTRNRIRHHLVPLLETYNPSVRLALRRLATLAQDDARVIDELVDREWRDGAELGDDAVRFDARTFAQYPRGVASRLLRRAGDHLSEHRTPLTYDQVERCLTLVGAGAGTARLGGGLEWRVFPATVALVKVQDSAVSPGHQRRQRQ